MIRGATLAPKDDTGLLDPFVRVETLGRRAVSTTKQQTADPVYDERLEIKVCARARRRREPTGGVVSRGARRARSAKPSVVFGLQAARSSSSPRP